MKKKITKRSVDAVSPSPSGDVFLWDVEARGFGVRIKPSGVRSFVISYYAPGLHRKRRRYTFGAYGPMTVEEGRRQALDLLARIGRGEDPAKAAGEERRSARDETVASLFSQYLDDGIGRRRKRTLEYYQSLGKLYVLPALGDLPVAKVSSRDVADLHRSLRDKPVTANRVGRLIRSFFYWLARRKVITGENPATNIDWYPEKARERFLTVQEMSRLGHSLRIAEAIGLPPAPQHRKTPSSKRPRNAGMFATSPQPASPVAVAALRFLMLTGWREQEALTLRWDAISLETGNVVLEDTKNGKSVRVLPAPALEIIAAQPRASGSPYVFPGRNPAAPLREMQRLWYAVRLDAQLEDVRLHDLRHSVASFAGAQGYSLFLIGKLLGHKDQRSTARYAHLAEDVRKTMADDVGALIYNALSARTHPDIASPTAKKSPRRAG